MNRYLTMIASTLAASASALAQTALPATRPLARASVAAFAVPETFLPATRPVKDASVPSPRWPAGVRFVFDSYGKTNRPLGTIHPGTVPMLTTGDVFVGGWDDPSRTAAPVYDDEQVRRIARDAAKWTKMIALDLETWPQDIRTYSLADVQKTKQHRRRLLKLFREGAPDLQVGIYRGVTPDYWLAVDYVTGLNQLAEAQRLNRSQWAFQRVGRYDEATQQFVYDPNAEYSKLFTAFMASNDARGWGIDASNRKNNNYSDLDASDFITTDCYLQYNRVADNGRQASEDIKADRYALQINIREAKRVAKANGDKPVLVYMMTLLHEASTTSREITDERWEAMLDVIVEEDVHLILWGYGDWDDYHAAKFDRAVARVAKPGKP